LERVKRLLRALCLGARAHQHQVLDADAVSPGFVVAGLVPKDHAALERDPAELGNARRAFVHRQVAADAVPGTVVEVEAARPQRRARETVELRASGALGEDRARDADMALQTAAEAAS